MTIARTVAEAQVGERLWLYKNRWRESKWEMVTVLKVARIYLTAGNPKYPNSADAFTIVTGYEKMTGGMSPAARVYGWQDRLDEDWIQLSRSMAEHVKNTKDPAMLREIAFALGINPPAVHDNEPVE